MPGDDRTARILDEIRAIPRGFVRAYSDVEPGAPRLVGRILSETADGDAPWWRVVRADGSVPKGERQLDLLRRERVPLRGLRVDMPAARYPAATCWIALVSVQRRGAAAGAIGAAG